MAVIGTFTPAKDGGWVGTIRTLTIDAKVRLVPNDDRTSKKAPAFRVFVGNSRIGDAWEAKTGGLSPKNYLRLKARRSDAAGADQCGNVCVRQRRVCAVAMESPSRRLDLISDGDDHRVRCEILKAFMSNLRFRIAAG